jgi:hypothetical protein
MTLNKRQTYLAVLIIGLSICLLYQSLWIFSSTTKADLRGTFLYRPWWAPRGVYLMRAFYTINYTTYEGHYMRDGVDMDKQFFEVRYLLFARDISRRNNFISNWGPLIVFFILWFIVVTIVFVRKDIIADQALFLLDKRPPFLKLVNNELEDYDQHDIVRDKLNSNDQADYEKYQTLKESANTDEVAAAMFTLNPTAVIILIVYVIYFFLFFASLLSQKMGPAESVIRLAILIFVPVYVQNTNNKRFKMKIPEQGVLRFSAKGITCRSDFYPIDKMESAVVSLESFDGFTYRDRTTTGMSKTRLYGDNNKISFKNNGEVSDLNFILNSAKDYWAFKHIIANWSEKGVNVFLQTVFEDDYIIQEMVHFHTTDV